MQFKEHWEQVYTRKETTSVSWFQAHAQQSLALIQGSGVATNASIIDVGGGASTLVDDLLDQSYSRLSVLDLSEAALSAAKVRLGTRADAISWLAGDITQLPLPAMLTTSGTTAPYSIS